MAGTRRSWGRLRKLPGGRYQAGYIAPDGQLIYGPTTFGTKVDAEGWLAAQRRAIDIGAWRHPDDIAPDESTFGDYAELWITERDLRPRTRAHYRRMLDRFILPTFDAVPLSSITGPVMRRWYANTAADTPTYRSHAYALVRTILNTAHRDGLIDAPPPVITGAGHQSRAHKVEPATLDELAVIVSHTPDEYRLMVLFAAWCALRFGEVTELRRKDIDQKNGVVRIRRAVVLNNGRFVVGPPKTSTGIRDVTIPPHLNATVADHLRDHTRRGAESLLFTADDGGHLGNKHMRRWWEPARKAAKRPDLRFHDLRHTGAVMAAQSGATLAELMGRLGHSSPAAALIYQHVAGGRDAEIARRLSEMATDQ